MMFPLTGPSAYNEPVACRCLSARVCARVLPALSVFFIVIATPCGMARVVSARCALALVDCHGRTHRRCGVVDVAWGRRRR